MVHVREPAGRAVRALISDEFRDEARRLRPYENRSPGDVVVTNIPSKTWYLFDGPGARSHMTQGTVGDNARVLVVSVTCTNDDPWPWCCIITDNGVGWIRIDFLENV